MEPERPDIVDLARHQLVGRHRHLARRQHADLDDDAAGADHVEQRGERRHGAGGLDADIEMALAGLVAVEPVGCVAHVDDLVGAAGLGDLERLVDQVGDRDLPRPLGARGQRSEAADRPGAGDHHAAAEDLARPLDRVQADGERLGAGRDPPGHGIRDDVALVGARDDVLGEGALDMREDRGAAEEAHVAAEIAAPGAAVVAGEAGPARVDRHPVAGLQARDGGAGLDDLARPPRGRAPAAPAARSRPPGP